MCCVHKISGFLCIIIRITHKNRAKNPVRITSLIIGSSINKGVSRILFLYQTGITSSTYHRSGIISCYLSICCICRNIRKLIFYSYCYLCTHRSAFLQFFNPVGLISGHIGYFCYNKPAFFSGFCIHITLNRTDISSKITTIYLNHFKRMLCLNLHVINLSLCHNR